MDEKEIVGCMYIKFSEKFALRKKNLIETERKNREKSIFAIFS